MLIIQLYLHLGLNYIFIIKNLKFYKNVAYNKKSVTVWYFKKQLRSGATHKWTLQKEHWIRNSWRFPGRDVFLFFQIEEHARLPRLCPPRPRPRPNVGSPWQLISSELLARPLEFEDISSSLVLFTTTNCKHKNYLNYLCFLPEHSSW